MELAHQLLLAQNLKVVPLISWIRKYIWSWLYKQIEKLIQEREGKKANI